MSGFKYDCAAPQHSDPVYGQIVQQVAALDDAARIKSFRSSLKPICNHMTEKLLVEQWGPGVRLPLTIRENEEGKCDVDFISDDEDLNAEVILCREHVRTVGKWLIKFADENGIT